MKPFDFDVVVVGAGAVGQSVALAAAEAGQTTALAEGRAFGGTCPLRGCDPKLVLHAAAQATYSVQRLRGKGFTNSPDFEWSDLMAWKRTFTEPVPQASRKKMKEAGIRLYADYAAFADPHTLRIGEQTITAATIVLATGMQPTPLDIPGSEHLLTSDDFLDMDDLPAEMVIVGGGYIGAETAHICAAFGCKITLVITESVPLDKFDPDLALLMRKSDEDRGMTFHLNSKATAVEKVGDRFRVTVEDKAEHTTTVDTDRVIHCAGRTPLLEPLQLDKAGIDHDRSKGIAVDDRLRTSVEHIYALGDCSDSGLPLTPVGSYEAGILSRNLFGGGDERTDYGHIPTVAYCLPPIASVGMTADEVEKSDRKIVTRYEEATDWYHGRHVNAAVFAFKVFVDREKDILVGAHILGPKAEEMINLAFLAIRQEMPLTEFKKLMLAYPTGAATLKSMLPKG